MHFRDLLQELGAVKKFRTEPKDSAVAEFKSRGGTVTGGAFSTVWMHPRWNYVWKTFPHNQAYIQFLDYAAKHPNNPHFPRIFKMKKIVPPYARPNTAPTLWAVKMEKLNPLSKENWEMVDAARGILLQYNFQTIDQFKAQYPEQGMSIMRTIQMLEDGRGRQKPQAFDDLHKAENFMQRSDGTVVITDPWFTDQTKMPKPTHQLAGGTLDKLKESFDTLEAFEASGGRVASGKFSVVLSHPDWKHVWKVTRGDPGYKKFLELIEHSTNPHFPQVMGIRVEGDLFMTKIEALQPLDDSNWQIVKNARRVLNHWMSSEAFAKKLPDQVGVLDAMMTVASNRRGSFLDFERENFMQRVDRSIVITDPMWQERPNAKPIEFDGSLIQSLT